jgi:hypothetical protein
MGEQMFAYGSDGVREAAAAGLAGDFGLGGGAYAGGRDRAGPGLPSRRPAPRPLGAVADEAGADGVVEDVLDRGFVVLFAVDDPRREALREQRAAASVTGVVLSGVVALVPLGSPREILRAAVDDRVVVRPHQAPDVEAELEADEGAAEEPQEQEPVEYVQEERRLVDAVRCDVEVAVRQLGTEDSGHAATLRLRPTANGLCREPVALPLPF